VPLPAAIPIAALIGGSLANIFATRRAAGKQEEFTEEQREFTEEQREKALRDARRQALLRAVGASTITQPQAVPLGPEPPDLTTEQTIAGLGRLGAQLGAMGLSRIPTKTRVTPAGLPGQSFG
jgi:hypothetical protein